MLVLSRRKGERIMLPGLNVVITVVGVTPHRVRLGIEAPPEVNVVREELMDLAAVGAASDPSSENRSPPDLQGVLQWAHF